MGKMVTISDGLAALLEERRKQEGYPSIDATAEALLSQEFFLDDEAVARVYTVDELLALIKEADESGPAVPWDPAEFRAEVMRLAAEKRQR